METAKFLTFLLWDILMYLKL